jgi:hypothetical protein
MKYQVIPFVASMGSKKEKKTPSEQLEDLINTYTQQGWDYIRVESITTFVAGNSGCFGLGATPSHTTSRQMIVFRKSS